MSTLLDNIINHLTQVTELHQQVEQKQLVEQIRQLQNWQTQRLLASHHQLWSDKRFKPAMQFFIDELYGPKDFSQRDQEIAKVVPKMAKILPANALSSLESALKLNALSYQMDIAMVEQLNGQPVNRDSYANAYFECNNPALRALQIDLLETLGTDLADVVKIKGISTLLMLSRKPAKLAGVESLHQFLESGFKAFKKLGDVHSFIDPIIEEERRIMQLLFAPEAANPLPEVTINE